ncbi:MAG: rhomboid family intramembrane serine protease [Haloplanus sp.]
MSGLRDGARGADPTPGADSDGVLPRTTALGERSPTVETGILTVAVFLIQYPLTLFGLVGLFALGPGFLREPWTLLTSVYAHGGPGHLLGNLLGLALFGGVVERVSSRARFHAFVVLTGALSGVAEVTLGSVVALDPRAVVGASGAVFGLLGYAIAGNGLADRLFRALDRATARRWMATVALVGLAVAVAVVTSGPRTAVVGHAAGLSIGLLAGRRRVLHVR